MKHIETFRTLIADHKQNAILSIVAIVYGIFVIILFLLGTFTVDGKFDKSFWGCFHIIVWTVAPPIWFFFEYYVLNYDKSEPELLKIKIGQEMAKNFWAAILAVILFLVPK